jgi:hypothetical protein
VANQVAKQVAKGWSRRCCAERLRAIELDIGRDGSAESLEVIRPGTGSLVGRFRGTVCGHGAGSCISGWSLPGWARLAAPSLIWVAVPLVLGMIRLLRRELK